jgi:hypothetical protein
MDPERSSLDAPGDEGRGAGDDDAWAEVVARWEDEAAHRAYLAARAGLDGLAAAGRRYRAALEERPGDPVAARWRDEVLRRATAVALAALPRTPATHPGTRWARTAGWGLLGVLLGAAGWLAIRLLGGGAP